MRLFLLTLSLLATCVAAPLHGAPAPVGEAPVPAVSRLDLTLSRAIELGLDKNFQIQGDAFLPDIARQRLRSASGRFDPEVAASYLYSEATDRTLIDPFNADARLSHITQTQDFDVGLRGLLPWGATYRAGISGDATRSTDSGFDTTTSTAPEIGITQPLLRGFGFGANLAGIRIARTNARISEWQVRQTVIDVVTEVVLVYNDLFASIENLGVAERFRDLAQQTLHDNTRRAEIGVMSPLDITTARAEAAAREEAVIVAQRRIQDNQNFLKRLISDDVSTVLSMEIRIAPPPSAVAFHPNVNASLERAFQLRPDYQQALLDLRRRNINIVLIANEALPRLDLTASLRFLGVGDEISDSLDRAFRRDRTDWTAGAVFSVPFPNRERLGTLGAARLEESRALIDLKRLEQDIVVEVDNAAGQIATTQQRITSTREARRLAYESLDAGEERLRAGTGTTFEVLELQKNLAEAEAAEIRAATDFNRAVAEFDRRTGVTIEHHNIIIKP